MLHKGRWTIPIAVRPNDIRWIKCEAVYSFLLYPREYNAGLLDTRPAQTLTPKSETQKQIRGDMIINGVEVATLAHGISDDPVASHEFFGTEAVVYTLSRIDTDGWNNGFITLRDGCMIRKNEPELLDEKGPICDIDPDFVIPLPAHDRMCSN